MTQRHETYSKHYRTLQVRGESHANNLVQEEERSFLHPLKKLFTTPSPQYEAARDYINLQSQIRSFQDLNQDNPQQVHYPTIRRTRTPNSSWRINFTLPSIDAAINHFTKNLHEHSREYDMNLDHQVTKHEEQNNNFYALATTYQTQCNTINGEIKYEWAWEAGFTINFTVPGKLKSSFAFNSTQLKDAPQYFNLKRVVHNLGRYELQ